MIVQSSPCVQHSSRATQVRIGSFASVSLLHWDVRFQPVSDQIADVAPRQQSASFERKWPQTAGLGADQVKRLMLVRIPHSAPPRILAIIFLSEDSLDPLFAPNLPSCPFGMFEKGSISLRKITVNSRLALLYRSIVAIVQYRARHATEHRFDNVQKLRIRRQRHKFNQRRVVTVSEFVAIHFIDDAIERFRRMPRCRVPRKKMRLSFLYPMTRRRNSLIISFVFFFLE